MKRTFRILLAVVGVLVALVILAMIALPLFFDPNDYKAQINAAIERQIGREVDISGDIGLSVFPWLGLELGRVEVANAEGFGDEPMAEMNSAEISVKLLPLISRDIEVGTVSLNGLRLRLARNGDGRSNWADISEHLAEGQAEAAEEEQTDAPDDSDGEGGFTLESLQVGAIDVKDAAVSWQDATTGADYRATGVKLSTGRLVDGEPVRLEFSGNMDAPKEEFAGDFNLITRIEPNIEDQFYRFSDMSLNVLATGKAVPNGKQQATLGGNGEFDMAEGRLKLSGVSLQAAGLNVTGSMDGTGLNGEPSYSGRVTVKRFDPRAVMRELAIEPPATQDSGALSSVGFDAQFNADNNRVQFKQILATLDDSSLKGSAGVANFENPAVTFDLDLDELNVDDYLPPGSAEQAQTEKPPETGGGTQQEEAEIDLSGLKDLRLDGKLSAGSLTAANINVTNAELTVKARDGVLTIEPLTADLYDGNVRVTARVDASKDTPRYALKGNLNGLQFQPLLKDVADTERVAALANMNIDITTAGKQVASMKRALNGKLGFDLRDGAFNGFNLAQVIASARSRLSGDGSADGGDGLGESENTPFNRFAASFNVVDGVMAGRDLNLVTKLLEASGSGSYDLAKNALDYNVSAKVPENASGKLSDLAGLTVPISLTGNLLSPNYSLDVKSALRGAAEKRLQDEKAKLQDKVREKLKERTESVDSEVRDKVKQGLRGLFGGQKKSADESADSSPDSQ
ncbi:AsmA family protein [Salinisphaera dokdonensis CL-ES53]|uniref:AsmA family protein n=1 Tax=Salinisphaera dokdonensis CL-ES53 TaxID=1304272 RepID=A0ABV2AZ94_9GAMM